jgi:hypothetical protein
MRTIAIATLFCLCASVPAWAQAAGTSQIQGTVQDATGATVPAAEVKVTQTDTGLIRTALSGADGGYVITNLPAGPYTLEASKPGFSRYVQTGIVLQVATAPAIDIQLRVGSITEQVQVEANAALVETQLTSVGAVIESQRILELPLNGRQATELIGLAGAAVPQGQASSRAMQGGVAISIAGGQSWGVAYLLDGALHTNPFDNLNLPFPFPDALQEFKVETSAQNASNGGHGAATVNALIKSGTNEWHGDLFEFVRNYKFNAQGYFATRKESLKRNQFGGVIGGPILRNKLFFFGGYQGTRTRSDPSEVTGFVPTPQMLAGDFTAFRSAACNNNIAPPALRAPFVNNQLPASQVDRVALAIAAKLPQALDQCGRVVYGAVQKINEYQMVSKADYQLSDKHSLFTRYMATTYFQPPPFQIDPNILNTTTGGRDNLAQSITFGDTYLIGPTTVNSFRAAFNRTAIHRTNADTFGAPDVGINSYTYMPKYFLLNITGGFQIGSGIESESTFRTTTYGLNDDVSMIRGRHQIGFGGGISNYRVVWYANVRSPGQFTIDGSHTGHGLADFIAGRMSGPNPFLQAAPNELPARQWAHGYYIQDTWKATSRLTVNIGLRWEPWFPQQVINNAVYNFDMGRFQQGIRSQVFRRAPVGFYYPGDPGFPGQAGMNRRPANLAPRLGIAWDPTGSGKMSIRASYGMAYDYINGQFYANTSVAPPWGSEIRIPATAPDFIPLANPFQNSAGITNIFPATFDQNAPFSPYGPFISLKYNQQTTGVHAWNMSVQRQFGNNWLASITYVGNQTQHLWVSHAQNPGQFLGTGPCTLAVRTASGNLVNSNFPNCSTAPLNSRRLLHLMNPQEAQFIGFLDIYDDGGTQSYNGMILSLQKRFSNGVSTNVNYTWSHCIGDFTQGGGIPNVGTGYLDPNNRRLDRGNCIADRRHLVNWTGVYETPRLNQAFARGAFSGWRISALYRFRTGAPITVTTNLDRQQSGNFGQRVNLIDTNPYGDRSSLNNYLNPRAFEVPALGTIGSLGRFNLFGPSFFTIDTALSRIFRIRERQSVEIRGEAFNLSNSVRRFSPGLNISAANTFNRILNADDPRIMQFAIKYVF